MPTTSPSDASTRRNQASPYGIRSAAISHRRDQINNLDGTIGCEFYNFMALQLREDQVRCLRDNEYHRERPGSHTWRTA